MAAICIFNALWFRPDGGAERFAEYGAAAQPFVAEAGGEQLFPSLSVEQSLEGGLDPDLVAFVRYPSVEAFDAMRLSDAYQEIMHLRSEAITKAIATRCVLEPAAAPAVSELPDGVAVLNALWFRDGGAKTYDTYLDQARPLVEARGGHFIEPRLVPRAAMGEDFLSDLIFLGYYPTMEAVFDLVADPAYEGPAQTRGAAVDHSATTVLRIVG